MKQNHRQAGQKVAAAKKLSQAKVEGSSTSIQTGESRVKPREGAAAEQIGVVGMAGTVLVAAIPKAGSMEPELYEICKEWGPYNLREHAGKLERFARQLRERAASFPNNGKKLKWLAVVANN